MTKPLIYSLLLRGRAALSEGGAVWRYGTAALAVLVALLVRLSVFPALSDYSPYLPFVIAVMVAARLGGRGPGFVATALSALGVDWCFLAPARSFAIVTPAALAGLLWFVAVGFIISLLVGRLRESLLLLRQKTQLVHLSHDAIVTADSNRRITEWNGGAEEMYGWTEKDALGRLIHELLKTTSRDAPAAIDESLQGRGRWDGELNHQARDGHRLVVESRQVLLRNDRNEPVGIMEIDRDVTGRKHAEEKLKRNSTQLAATIEELKRVTQIVLHDFRAPFVNLKGFSAELRYSVDTLRQLEEALLSNLPPAARVVVSQALRETIPEALGFIESSVTRMDHLTAALLQLSRASHREFHLEELDTGTLWQEAVGGLAHQIESGQIALKAGPLPRIASDRGAIEQIFGSLLDNAVKYLDPNRPGQIEVSAEETADTTVFHVRDNGRGIAEDDMDKLFVPFRRLGPQDVPGEGMGLAFVRTLLQRLGGSIDCHSQFGVGTTFSFTLPRTR